MEDRQPKAVPALRATIHTVWYPGTSKPALSGIDLSIRQGEFVIVTGPAGAGKTTLAYCLTGVIPKSINGHLDGHIEVAGQDLAALPLPRVGPFMGLVMQVPENQLFNILVSEDVAFGPENLQLPVEEVEQRLWRYLDFTESTHLAGRFSHLLSGGQSQRVVLSSVLAMEAGIYVFDQPAAELDPAGRRQIYEKIFRLKQEFGKTIVLIEDRLGDVVPYADRIVLLDEGRLVKDLPPRQFFSEVETENYGIRLPQVVTLYRELSSNGFRLRELPLTVEELAAGIRASLSGDSLDHLFGHADFSLPAVAEGREEPAIKVTDLSYQYPTGLQALRNVNLRVEKGEFVAIVGENGAGKTTLAKHLVGLLRPSEGQVCIQGDDIALFPVHQISQRVGYLFQDPDYQTFNNSCLEEVGYGLKLRRLPEGEIQELATMALERVGLAERYADHPYTLSRGQRQRLAVAAVIALQPPILVVDEPSTGLDYRETRAMMELLAEYQRDGGTVIIITHDIEMAVQYSARTVVLSGGRILHDVPTYELHRYFDELGQAAVVLPDIVHLARSLGLPTTLSTPGDLVKILNASRPSQR